MTDAPMRIERQPGFADTSPSATAAKDPPGLAGAGSGLPGDVSTKGFGDLKQSPTNRWTVQQR